MAALEEAPIPQAGRVGPSGATQRRVRKASLPLAVILASLILAGCMGDAASTKAGAGAPPVTLQIGTSDLPGLPAANQVEHFAEVVNELSAGVLEIQPVWRAEGDELTDDWDQKVARRVVSGDLDLGLIPTRAWDTEGITTMRALNTPMLVTSDELVDQIAAGELASKLMSGLEAGGLHGLALLPEGIRRVMSYGDPLGTVAGFDGELIRAPESRTTYAMFAALGAIPGDASADDKAIEAGLVAGSESSFLLAPTLPRGPTSVVGNLPLWPKLNSLVVNSRAFADLSAAQQQVLRDAAIGTRDWVIATQPKDAQGADAYCAAGNTIVTIDKDEVAAFRAASEPVTTQLQQDATTRELIGDIQDLSSRLKATPATLAPCAPPAVVSGPDPSVQRSPSVQPSPAVQPSFPDGTYRAHVTRENLAQPGVLAQSFALHVGIWTLVFDSGHLTITDVGDITGLKHVDQAVYCVTGDKVSLGYPSASGSPAPCGTFWTARWQLTGDRLRFTDFQVHTDLVDDHALLPALFGSVAFTRVR